MTPKKAVESYLGTYFESVDGEVCKLVDVEAPYVYFDVIWPTEQSNVVNTFDDWALYYTKPISMEYALIAAIRDRVTGQKLVDANHQARVDSKSTQQ